MRSIKNYLPNSETKTAIVQARIEPSLLSDVTALCKENGWKVPDIIRASLEKLVDDEKPKQVAFPFRKVNFEGGSNKSAWK